MTQLLPGREHAPGFFETDIVDVYEMSKRLGLHRATVHRKYLCHPNFPRPVIKLGRSYGWAWSHVVAFMKSLAIQRKTI